MKRNERYNTKQKEKILNLIKDEDGEFTIKDIYERTNHKVGLTTIYRLIDNLVKDGYISKNIGKDNTTHYQYLEKCSEENHFYLRCEECGTMIHIDCDCISDLSHHINKEHKFKLSKDHIIINGLCDTCSRRHV